MHVDAHLFSMRIEPETAGALRGRVDADPSVLHRNLMKWEHWRRRVASAHVV